MRSVRRPARADSSLQHFRAQRVTAVQQVASDDCREKVLRRQLMPERLGIALDRLLDFWACELAR
jgi:hypothetical protein